MKLKFLLFIVLYFIHIFPCKTQDQSYKTRENDKNCFDKCTKKANSETLSTDEVTKMSHNYEMRENKGNISPSESFKKKRCKCLKEECNSNLTSLPECQHE